MDRSNNHCGHAAGLWIKEPYHSMHAYEQEQTAPGTSRLIVFAGNNLTRKLRLGI